MFIRNLFNEMYKELSETRTHGRHSVAEHCEKVEQIFLALFSHYHFRDEKLKLIGRLISLYHDIAKPKAMYTTPHAPPSAEHFLKNWTFFDGEVSRSLFLLSVYLICRHHSKLIPNCKLSNGIIDAYSINKALKESGLNHVDVADVFGLFKLADAFSASGEHYSRYVSKPSLSFSYVRKLMGDKIDEKRWREQLKISVQPDVTMLRAPTGWGKTTISFLFASNKETTRFFLLLPTITAIRKLFTKLTEIFGDDKVKEYFFLYDAEVAEDTDALRTIFFTKQFLAPYMITTIDQFLLSFLQVGKYYTKRVAFRGSTIVVDEVHVLSPIALVLAVHFIKSFIDNYKLRCLLMSATLPKSYRQYVKAQLPFTYFQDFGERYKELRRVLYEVRRENLRSAISDIISYVKSNKKVLVVANTVSKAISLAKQLEEQLEPQQITLLHARFTSCDRSSREEDLDSKLRNRQPHVAVTTQVCEVSLDVSYDVLFSELAPLGDMIQRFGRVNRYAEKTNHTNTFIFTGLEESQPYENLELDVARGTLENNEGNKLKNEWQLIKEFDGLFTYDKFLSIAEQAIGRNLESYIKEVEEYYKSELSFFSLDLHENLIRRLLEYRDRVTVLSLPDFKVIKDEALRKELENAVKRWENLKGDYEERLNALAMLKRFCIPVPVKPDRCALYKDTVAGFPKVSFGSYSRRYGLEFGS